MKWGRVDYKQLKRLQQKIDKLAKQEHKQFCEQLAKELAARLLSKLIKKTPVGQYHSGYGNKVGGTLRRGWTATNETQAMYNAMFGGTNNIKKYADKLNITKNGSNYVVEIINPVEYASYVNSGHRTRNHTGWVSGHFFVEISEKELEQQAPRIIEKKLEEYLRSVFDE